MTATVSASGDGSGEDSARRPPLAKLPRALHPATWSLRSQLVTLVVVVLVLVSAVIGAVSISVQRHILIQRIDDQLEQALHFSGLPPAGIPRDAVLPGNPSQAPATDPSPGPARFGSFSILVQDDEVRWAELTTDSGGQYAISRQEAERLLQEYESRADQQSFVSLTIDDPNLSGGSAAYRVLGQTVNRTDQQQPTQIRGLVGQSLAEVNRTTRELSTIFVATAAGVILIGGVAAYFLVRVSLRPLGRLRRAAKEVGETELASGQVELPGRIPSSLVHPGTEVGDVSASFNQMLDHVESSLNAREDTERKLKQFVADASHELRTPLAVVSGYAELAEREGADLDAPTQTALDRIRAEATRMGVMVEDLLLLARLDSGEQLGDEPVDVARVVIDAFTDARIVDPQRPWHLEIGEDAADLRVRGRSTRLRQAVLNLVSNAQKHTPTATPVTVSLTREQGAGGTLAVIRVVDLGPGIEPELQTALFDRFVRGDSVRTGGSGSTGLGTSITKAIVEAHGGQIEVSSRPGETIFTVRLPAT